MRTSLCFLVLAATLVPGAAFGIDGKECAVRIGKACPQGDGYFDCVADLHPSLPPECQPLSAPIAGFRADIKAGCLEDLNKLCPTVTGTQLRIKCLGDHIGKVSAACNDQLRRQADFALSHGKPCEKDLEFHCRTARDEDTKDCLIRRYKEISAACRKSIDKEYRIATSIKAACGPELKKECPNAKAQLTWRFNECLTGKPLSAGCQSEVVSQTKRLAPPGQPKAGKHP